MDLIILSNDTWQLITVTKQMLSGIEIPKGLDCFDICEIIRNNFNKFNIKGIFYGCYCGAEAPR